MGFPLVSNGVVPEATLTMVLPLVGSAEHVADNIDRGQSRMPKSVRFLFICALRLIQVVGAQ